MPNKRDFFEESSEASRVKVAIVTQYFWTWANIVKNAAKRRNVPVGYVDLFSGPGMYEDGTPSTPLKVLEIALNDADLRQMLVTKFNDANSNNIARLKSAIEQLAEYRLLRYKPEYFSFDVSEQVYPLLEDGDVMPTLFFIDPFGYKGLSLQLLKTAISGWGCDCIFFFNYNRINAGIDNPSVYEHMVGLFGTTRLIELQQRLKRLSSSQRELTIIDAVVQTLSEVKRSYVLPFRFRHVQTDRTSHYLIFVSKHFKGYDEMKKVMAKQSSSASEGVWSFEYNTAATKEQPMLDMFKPKPIEELKVDLLQKYSGQTIGMKQLYEEHSVNTPYLPPNYTQALSQLENEQKIIVITTKSKRPKGTFAIADHIIITFP